MTSPHAQQERFPGLDGLRIAGAVAVVSTHVGFTSGASLNGPFAGFLARMDVGVPLFFVVSGFLLYRPHALARLTGVTTPRTRTYLKHRALRILPPLVVAVAASALLLPHGPGVTTSTYLRNLTLTQIYTVTPSVAGLTQMWSLATEVAFYLLLPVLAWVLARSARPDRTWVIRTIVVLGLLSAVSAAWVGLATANGGGVALLWLPAYLGWFGIGMALAVWNVGRATGLVSEGVTDRMAVAPGSVYALAAAAFLLATTPLAGPYDLSAPTPGQAMVKNLAFGLIAGLVVLPGVARSARGTRLVAGLGSRPARALGDVSYGVFAYHLVVLNLNERAIGHVTFGGQFWQLWLRTLAITLPAAWVSYRFVERPIMRWGRRGEGSARPGDHPANTTTAMAETTAT